jgi:hypothetical protein
VHGGGEAAPAGALAELTEREVDDTVLLHAQEGVHGHRGIRVRQLRVPVQA